MSGNWRKNYFESSWNSSDTRYNVNEVQKINNEEELQFQSFEGYFEHNADESFYNRQNPSYLDPATPLQQCYDPYSPFSSTQYGAVPCEEEEPPLLEELGINPDRIVEKTLTVLNIFNYRRSVDINLLNETDLAGPLAYCILLGVCLLFAGGKAHFSYVYGLVMISCPLMYFLLSTMTNEGSITIGSVTSILGYCLMPIVFLSVFGIFLPLYNIIGLLFALLAVMWSSLSASRLFVTMSGDTRQRPLIAYPCALLYGTFALIIVF